MNGRLGILAGAAVILLLASGSPGHANGAPPTTFAPAASRAGTVTLITGDRVQVNGDGTPSVVRASGRAGIPMRIGRSKGHLSVVPADAAPMIASGQLDARLFDVTTLLADGYDDAHHADLPLIVRYRQGADRATAAAGTVRRQLPGVNGAAVTVAKSTTSNWWGANTRADRGGRALAAPYAKVWLDGKRRVTDDVSAAQIGAPAAYQAGLTGRGVRVAVIDSGVDTGHPDLAGRVDAAANFTTEPDGDHIGHGTHVASIVAGTGAASGGKYRGIAPDARLLDAKVCDQWGFCAEDAILAGMEWAAVTEHAPVANLSLGATDTPGTRPAEVPVGWYTGRLVATGPGTAVTTAVAVEKESEHYDLTINHVGRGGQALAWYVTFLDRVGDCDPDGSLTACGGVASTATGTTLRLPPGDYSLADFAGVTGDDQILMMDPDFHLTADRTVTLDTNRAEPVTLSAPRRSARTVLWELNVARDMHRSDGTIFDYFAVGDGSMPLYTADLATARLSADDLVSFVDGRLAEPGATGDFTDSRYEYELAHSTSGAFFTGLHLAPRPGEFATVNARYATVTDQPRDLRTDHGVWPVGARPALLDVFGSDLGGPGIVARTPFTRTEYYLADGLEWRTSLFVGDRQTDQVDFFLGETESHRYVAGRGYSPPRWVQGVFGPHLSDRPDELRPADTLSRQGDLLTGGIDMFVDSGARRWSISKVNKATARLYQDGQLVREWPSFTTVSVQLPPQEATYRLEAIGKQPATQVSTTVISDWTFRSGHLDGADQHPLPLLGVRYDPVLDKHNHAEAGTRYRVPIHLARQAGAGTATVTRVTLDVSSDDGTTWRPAPVIKDGAGWVATVGNPAGGAVSLRIHAQDSDGNALDQTTIRAYLVNS